MSRAPSLPCARFGLSCSAFNAFFVDMAYQFVIGLVFTIAGMLCASEESAA